jgi:hypothetical protein
MSLGKARFWVTKLADFKRSMFNVKTPTATCGVRGSDFINFVTAHRTETTALAKTHLELRRLAFPEKQPISITDNVYCPECGYEQAVVEEGVLWKRIVPPEEVEEMKRLFEIFQLAGPEEEELALAEMEDLFSDIVHQVHEDRMKAP